MASCANKRSMQGHCETQEGHDCGEDLGMLCEQELTIVMCRPAGRFSEQHIAQGAQKTA